MQAQQDPGGEYKTGPAQQSEHKWGYKDITAAVRKHPNAPEGFRGGQKDVDELAVALGLKAGKDFRNYPQMKKAIVKALSAAGPRKDTEKRLPGNKRYGKARKVIDPATATPGDTPAMAKHREKMKGRKSMLDT